MTNTHNLYAAHWKRKFLIALFAVTAALTAGAYALAPAPAAAFQAECWEEIECEGIPGGDSGDTGGDSGDQGGYGGSDEGGYGDGSSSSDDDGGGYYGDDPGTGPSWDDGYGDDGSPSDGSTQSPNDGQGLTPEEMCRYMDFGCPDTTDLDQLCNYYDVCWNGYPAPGPTDKSPGDPQPGHNTGDPCKDFGACTERPRTLEEQAQDALDQLQAIKAGCDALQAQALDARRNHQPRADDWYSKQWWDCERDYGKLKSQIWPFPGDPPKPKGKGHSRKKSSRAPKGQRADTR